MPHKPLSRSMLTSGWTERLVHGVEVLATPAPSPDSR